MKTFSQGLEKATYTELKRPFFTNLPNQKNKLYIFVDTSTTANGAIVYIYETIMSHPKLLQIE